MIHPNDIYVSLAVTMTHVQDVSLVVQILEASFQSISYIIWLIQSTEDRHIGIWGSMILGFDRWDGRTKEYPGIETVGSHAGNDRLIWRRGYARKVFQSVYVHVRMMIPATSRNVRSPEKITVCICMYVYVYSALMNSY